MIVSLPAPKVTLPLICPEPPVGNSRLLFPCVSVSVPLDPLSQMNWSSPAPGVSVHAAKTGWAVVRKKPDNRAVPDMSNAACGIGLDRCIMSPKCI